LFHYFSQRVPSIFDIYIKDNRYWIIIIATKGAMLEFIVSFAKQNNNLFKIHAE
jgi:hypothetical protein